MLPGSPISSDEDACRATRPPAPPIIGTQPIRLRRHIFAHPDRRLRAKTTLAPSEDLEELVQAAEEATAAELIKQIGSPDMGFAAGAEAAVLMGLEKD